MHHGPTPAERRGNLKLSCNPDTGVVFLTGSSHESTEHWLGEVCRTYDEGRDGEWLAFPAELVLLVTMSKGQVTTECCSELDSEKALVAAIYVDLLRQFLSIRLQEREQRPPQHTDVAA
jgi:hypothetical protein